MDMYLPSEGADTATQPFDVALLLAELERSMPLGAAPQGR
jgi:hypothetical protein